MQQPGRRVGSCCAMFGKAAIHAGSVRHWLFSHHPVIPGGDAIFFPDCRWGRDRRTRYESAIAIDQSKEGGCALVCRSRRPDRLFSLERMLS